ncbi:hypothetical protein Pogu_0614 [Pyrobaculum oguniense TE7]|uniref:Uncharacterized protein n=1 Tax=Pyrobaculum oguniense (strain DSM 13380 / JCM 10595 / TE7) TaxID=698757 RepID=H6Q7Y4_PYROT|nr:hypothetical protein Pogu_0614 [Pyrobaculum oguniense TE7]
MTDDLLQLIATTGLAVLAFVLFATAFQHTSTPSVCQAAKTALENPGTELLVYGKIRVWNDTQYVYLSCGLRVERGRVLVIERTEGALRVGSTADGRLYIK